MNISPVNCTPIKPQVSFGKTEEIDDAKEVLRLSQELSDGFVSSTPEKKNFLQTAISIGGVLLTTFVIGKVAMSKALTALKACPSITSSVSKGAASVKNFVKNKANKIVESDKTSKLVKKCTEKTVKFAKSASDKFANFVSVHGAENVAKTAGGVAAMAVAVPQIVTVDGNKDGYADIAQKGINAYSNALKQAGVVSEILEAVS